ncbi:MAG: hypothetical protein F6K10_19870 [Moorea sp. SIO2B7]|nr:hypothetical protein [Moorena sp. SIO2B7]
MTKLTYDLRESSIQSCSVALNWSKDSDKHPKQLQANTWVRLLELLNPFCHDEALILCQKSESEWVAWIPDHGESILNTTQFCLMG